MIVHERLQSVWPYVAAAGGVALGLIMRLVAGPEVGDDAAMLLFVGVVAAAAWYGGLGPALLAAGLILTVGVCSVLAPGYSTQALRDQMTRLLLFAFSSTVIVALTKTTRQHRANAETHSQRLRQAEESLQSHQDDRRQMQEQLREQDELLTTLINALPDCVSLKDGQGRWLIVNQAQLELFRVRPSDCLGKSDRELAAMLGGTGPYAEAFATCARTDEQAWLAGKLSRCEETIRSPDGRECIFDVVKVPLFDLDGRRKALVAVGRDVTERRLVERERTALLQAEKAARAEAERANRAKEDFLATLSHELRTPLTSILGWAEMLLRRRDQDYSQTRHGLEVIQASAQEQAQIVTDLLDVSNLIKGTLRLHIEPVDLRDVIKASLDTINLAAQARRIRVAWDLEPEASLVNGDRGRLQQVVWNLLSNAVKFTPEGGQIDVRLRQAGDDHARLTVTDTGVGIPHDLLPYVFERFRQVDGSTTRRYGGLGLGLAIVRQIVEMHGGTVHADSPGEGKGTTFTVELPLMGPDAGGL
jgi:PAS domain S-box-containing protein